MKRTTWRYARLVGLVAACLSVGVARADDALSEARDAYHAGDIERAYDLAQNVALEDKAEARRLLAKIMLSPANGDGRYGTRADAIGYLVDLARAGDRRALIKLEMERRKGGAGAPVLSDLIEIEKDLARDGDAVTAWRLAGRYRTGNGVAISSDEEARWLKIVAGVSVDRFPRAGDAVVRLCEIYAMETPGRMTRAARRWCEKAADQGNPAATVYIRRLSSLR